MENFVPMPFGGVNRRPGTQFIEEVKDSSKKTRLMDFRFSSSTNFILEFSDLAIRFYSNGARVESGGSPVTVTSPYLEAELFEIQYLQIKDVVYLTHPNHEPRKLTRVSDTSWTLDIIEFDTPVFRAENLTSTTITPSAATGSITLTASDSIFESGHVGSYWRISHQRSAGQVKLQINGTGTSSTILGRGTFEFQTTGTWDATIQVQQSLDGGTTWEVLREYESTSDRNVRTNILVEKTSLLRIEITSHTSGSGNRYAYLDAPDNFTHGVVKITGYTSGTVASADVVGNDLIATTATKYWSEAAWSDQRGWPRTVQLHESRVFYGGVAGDQALTVWGSVIEDFENFQTGTNDDDAVSFTMASAQNNQINWMVSQARTMIVGTSGGEWTLQSRNQDEPITPTNIVVRQQSRFGSAFLPASVLNSAVFFVQRQGEKIRDWRYVFQDDNYSGPDITILAEHLTESGIVQLASAQEPFALLWCVNNDGELLSFTFEESEDVRGWARQTTDGTIESVATIPGTYEDEVWMVVKRTVDGSTKRFVERLHPDTNENMEASTPEDCVYLDSAVVIDNGGSPSTSITAAHLPNTTVSVLADGAVRADVELDGSGNGTLDSTATKVVAGLPMTSVLETMPLVAPMDQGSTYGRYGTLERAVVVIDRSIGFEHSTEGYNASEPDWFYRFPTTTDDDMDDHPPVRSETAEITVRTGVTRQPTLSIRQVRPQALSVLSLNIGWSSTQNT